MKCKFCGHDKFFARQEARIDVIVDGKFMCADNIHYDVAADIHDREDAFGPFTCEKCGAEYEELKEGDSYVISGPSDEAKSTGFRVVRTKKFFYNKHENGQLGHLVEFDSLHYKGSFKILESGEVYDITIINKNSGVLGLRCVGPVQASDIQSRIIIDLMRDSVFSSFIDSFYRSYCATVDDIYEFTAFVRETASIYKEGQENG